MKKEIQNNLKQEYDFKPQGARVRSRINWFEKGETSSKYFFSLEKRNGKEKSWEAILDSNGNLVHGTKHILNRQAEYYQTLYATETVDESKQRQFLYQIKRKLSVDSVALLDQDINEKEINKAVFMLKNNKSPGPDGIISEFYKMFWNSIQPIYLKVIQDIYTSEEMTFTQYQAIISLLY